MIECIDEERCNGCRICIEVCPCDVFRLESGERLARIAYPDDCQTCYTCELDCPRDAIRVGPTRKLRLQAW